VVAPSGPVPEPALAAGCTWLREQGYELDLRLPERPWRYLAGPDAERAALLQGALTDPLVDVVWAARGGYGLHRILATLDWVAIADVPPRAVVGFSDITALLLPLSARCPTWRVVHGPNITTLAQVAASDRAATLGVLGGDLPVALPGLRTVTPGQASGPLLAGNLCLVGHLAGTPCLPPARGRIVVLEEVGEPPYRVDRLLTGLYLAGWFEGVAGVALGEFVRCQAAGLDALEVATDLLAGWLPAGTPLVTGLPVGHAGRCAPLLVGAPYSLQADSSAAALCPVALPGSR